MDNLNILATLASGAIGAIVTHLLKKKKILKKDEEIQTLKEDNTDLGLEIKNLENSFPKDLAIINDSTDVLRDKILPLILQYIANSNRESHPVKIENLGLDLETVMPWINQKIVCLPGIQNIGFEMRALIINPESPHLKDTIDGKSNISTSTIRASIESAKNLAHKDLYRFHLELRQFDLPPLFHGFLLNDQDLFIGFTEIDSSKLIGGNKPYLHLCRKDNDTSEITRHYFNSFKHWFSYYWDRSNVVADVRK